METTERLTATLTEESKAYGYTLTIWGAGALLISRFGMPEVVGVYLYVAGALTAFALLSTLTFQSLLTQVESDPGGKQVVASMVHFGASFVNLAIVQLVAYRLLAPTFPPRFAFLVIGFQATLSYNLLLLLEEAVARQVAQFVGPSDL